MNRISESSGWQPVPSGFLQQAIEAGDWTSRRPSMVRRFFSTLLLVTTVAVMLWFVCSNPYRAASIVAIIGSVALATSLVKSRGDKLLRITILLGTLVTIYLFTIGRRDPNRPTLK